MDLALSPGDLAFRDEVRAFLDEKFTPDLRAEAARQAGVFAEADLNSRWHRILHQRGWIAPAWPKAYGGAEFTAVQRYIFDSELAEAGTPAIPAMGLQMCGPVLMGYGTAEQKAFFLPRMLSGEHYWCQGYSEPQAGSDLAALQCHAVRDDDHYVVNGTKIWTTHAHYANWMFLLVRTKTEGKPQAGITFLLLDMRTPGLTIQPIITLSGEHEVNQVFFDNVRIPIANRVGEENQGWTVAKYLLEFERGGSSFAARLRGALRQVKAIAQAEAADRGGALWTDPDFRTRFAQVEVETLAVEFTERRVVSQLSTGAPAGDASASMLKLKGTETMQKATELAVEAIGHYAAADQRMALGVGANVSPVGPDHAATPVARYLNARASTIYGGSSEVQRNILARAALGL
ncbi:acyl-CoA dehydrogenase family protein [Phenylobacterium montanum]|uniref:Acyl-CoA dehydrogenase family protein n=1 Tax=Phenylobacterium montanum TaxID=2823693 RepID=A0A975IWX3_9CAUL|nr:acyl-CoA dehydrogenase family protein [Caulobacter sp. S6]QUD90527.1 acyl-CoA dehydrogenase family protein [Caulobacter sp. S6]